MSEYGQEALEQASKLYFGEAPIAAIAGAIQAERNKADALAAFKAWTHSWLDAHGVPADPDPEKTRATGCRIGGRMEWLWARRDALREELKVARDALQESARMLCEQCADGEEHDTESCEASSELQAIARIDAALAIEAKHTPAG